jgi:hypothetical protein
MDKSEAACVFVVNLLLYLALRQGSTRELLTPLDHKEAGSLWGSRPLVALY